MRWTQHGIPAKWALPEPEPFCTKGYETATSLSEILQYSSTSASALAVFPKIIVRCAWLCSVFSSLLPKFVSIPASSIPLAIINLLGFVSPIDGINQPQSTNVKVRQSATSIW